MELRFQGKIFHSKRMSFYIFGNTIYLGKIPEADWVSYICSRFNKAGITISELASPFQKGTLKILLFFVCSATCSFKMNFVRKK